jgi:hypothetical protein
MTPDATAGEGSGRNSSGTVPLLCSRGYGESSEGNYGRPWSAPDAMRIEPEEARIADKARTPWLPSLVGFISSAVSHDRGAVVAVDAARWHPTAPNSLDFAYRSGSAPVSFSRRSLALCSTAKSTADLAEPLGRPRCSHSPPPCLFPPCHFHLTLILPSASSAGQPSWTCWSGAPSRVRTTAPSTPRVHDGHAPPGLRARQG